MKTAWILTLSLFLSWTLNASEKIVSARYHLPLPKNDTEILAAPLSVLQTSTREISEQTEFGNRIYKPLVSIVDREAENQRGQLLVQKEGQLTLELQSGGSPWIHIGLTGQPVFFQVRGSYLDGIKTDPKASEIELPISTLEFDQEDGDWEWIRYRLFVAMDEIPPVFENDIRSSYNRGLESYMQEYGRFDAKFGMDEVPQRGLRTNKFQKREGYVFSTCVEFRERRRSDSPEKSGDCYLYSLAEQSSVLPVIAGKNLRNYPQSKGLYLVERERKLRNSDTVERHWTKVVIPAQKFVSLKSARWQDLP